MADGFLSGDGLPEFNAVAFRVMDIKHPCIPGMVFNGGRRKSIFNEQIPFDVQIVRFN